MLASNEPRRSKAIFLGFFLALVKCGLRPSPAAQLVESGDVGTRSASLAAPQARQAAQSATQPSALADPTLWWAPTAAIVRQPPSLTNAGALSLSTTVQPSDLQESAFASHPTTVLALSAHPPVASLAGLFASLIATPL